MSDDALAGVSWELKCERCGSVFRRWQPSGAAPTPPILCPAHVGTLPPGPPELRWPTSNLHCLDDEELDKWIAYCREVAEQRRWFEAHKKLRLRKIGERQ